MLPPELALTATSIKNAHAVDNFAEHLPERRKMMQPWADYLDGLRTGAKVRKLHQSA